MSNTLVRNTRVHIEADDVPDETILQSSFELGDDFDVQATREGIIDMLAHVLSARFRGHLTNAENVPKPRDLVVREVGARWGTTALDEYAIRRQTVIEYDHVRKPSRIKPYGPLSRITAADLNAIQDGMLIGPCPGTDKGENALVGGDWVAFDVTCNPDGSSSWIDQNLDWRDRFVVVAVRYALDNDIRPGQANDDDFNTTDETVVLGYLGDGGDTSGYEITIDTNIILYAHAPSGALAVKNNLSSPSNVLYMSGLLIATQDLGERP